MAEKRTLIHLRRWSAVLLALIVLGAAGLAVRAQSPQASVPARATTATTIDGTTGVPVEPPDSEIDNNIESDALTAVSPTAGGIDSDIGRRRSRPERPYYFLVQYAQRYDDNVLLDEADRLSDTVAVPEFGFGAQRIRSRSLLHVDYRGGAEIYRRFSEFNTTFHSLFTTAEYDLSKRTTIFVSNHFLRQPGPARFGALALGGTGAALSVLKQNNTTVNDLSAGFTRLLDRRTRLRAAYSYTLSRFAEPRLVDSNEQALEIGYEHEANRRYSYELTYRFSHLSSHLSSNNNFLTNSFIPSFSYRSSAKLRLRLGAGPQLVNGRENNSLSWAALAELAYSPSHFTALALRYRAGVGTGGGLATATRNQTLFGSFAHIFRNKLQTEFGLGYTRARALESLSIPFATGSGLVNKEVVFESTLSYPIAEHVAIFFDYSHARQFGDALSSVKRNLFSAGISFDTRVSTQLPRLRSTRR
ncbi:MAG: hypothetical protein AB1489_05205 [Acidobacteriota bacterium]